MTHIPHVYGKKTVVLTLEAHVVYIQWSNFGHIIPFWLAAWWALWLPWWPPDATMLKCTYWYLPWISVIVFTPQPLRAPGYCRTPSGRAAGQTSPVNTLTSTIFHGSFSNLARTFITLRSQVRSWRFCLIKYAHNGPFNEPASFDIPELILQAKVTKYGI